MSVAFSSVRPRTKAEVTPQTIQKMLDENHHLIQCIMDYQSKGKTAECTQYQQILHRNLVYLATIADSNQNMQSLLPAPPTHDMGMGQSSAQTSGNDNMAPGLTAASLIQGNGHSHTLMRQSIQAHPTAPGSNSHPGTPSQSSMEGPSSAYASSSSSSFNLSNLSSQSSQVSMMQQQQQQQQGAPHYSSAQMGGPHYQGQPMGMMAQGSQGNNMLSQRQMGTYRTPQPAGHGEYSYQQPSYGEQYDRSFDDSSPHYYEGNSQYNQQQQQGQYQQGSSQQPFGQQQQYSSQPGYGAPPQGYGPGQGSSSQYSQYQQGQGQQYGSYRSSQGGGQPRPYSYEQGQYGNYQQ